MTIKYTEEIEKIIVDNYNNGKSPYWMIKNIPELKSKKASSIYSVLNRLNVDIRRKIKLSEDQVRKRKKYTLNDNYFESIDSEEKAYWLGFLMADGFLAGKNNIGLTLSTVDKNHILKFKTALDSTYPIKTYKQSSGYSEKTVYSKMVMSSNKMYKDLERFGFKDKTYNSKFPFSISSDLYYHFIRGYVDGDGSITVNRILKNNLFSYSLKLTGTTEIINDMKKLLSINVINERRWPDRDNNNVSISVNGNIQVTRILKKLYGNSTIYLDRKYAVYLKVLEQNCRSI